MKTHPTISITIVLISTILTLIISPLASPLYAQGGAVTGSKGNPEDAYLEFTLTGADLTLREGTDNHYEGPLTGETITLSGKMIVNRVIEDPTKGGGLSYVSFFGFLHDQNKDLNHYFKWPEDESMRLVQNRVETQEASISFIVPPDYTEPTVEGAIVVELCGQACSRIDFLFTITIPPQDQEPLKENQPIPAQNEQDPCPKLNPDEKLTQILNQYYTKIPKGITSSGPKNNLYQEILWRRGIRGKDNPYDPFLCGGYQSVIIDMLARIKFSNDPCQAALLDDFDYGPIHSYWGGHQAVVLYPKGTDWTVTGIVLDPWITQSPTKYPIALWSGLMKSTLQGTGLIGAALDTMVPSVGPSEEYKAKDKNYPMFGLSYQPPGDLKLTEEELAFRDNQLSAAELEYFRTLPVVEGKKWLREKMAGKDNKRKVIAHCPVNLYLLGPDGNRSGITSDQIYDQLLDVTFMQIPLADGTVYTEMEYPADAPYTLFIEGIGNGITHLLIGDAINATNALPPTQLYTFTAQPEKIYQVSPDILGAPLISEGVVIQPISIQPDSNLSWIETLSQPLEISTNGEENSIIASLTKAIANPPLWIGLVILICGLVGLGLFAFLVFVRAITKQQSTKPSTKTLRLVLLAGLISVSCLFSLCGAGGLYLNLSQPKDVINQLNTAQTPVDLAQTELALALQQTEIALAVQKTGMALPGEPSANAEALPNLPTPTVPAPEEVIQQPSPTLQPPTNEPALTGGQYLTDHSFFDDFSSNAMGWPVINDSDLITEYTQGAYRIRVVETGINHYVFLPTAFFPYVVNFDVTSPTNIQDGTFGVICQYQDDHNYYYLEIDTELGYYTIVQLRDGQSIPLTKEKVEDFFWEPIPSFIIEPNAKNQISVSCYRDGLTLFANNEFVTDVAADQPFTQDGPAGILIYAFPFADDEDYQIIIDNVEAYRPVQ